MFQRIVCTLCIRSNQINRFVANLALLSALPSIHPFLSHTCTQIDGYWTMDTSVTIESMLQYRIKLYYYELFNNRTTNLPSHAFTNAILFYQIFHHTKLLYIKISNDLCNGGKPLFSSYLASTKLKCTSAHLALMINV